MCFKHMRQRSTPKGNIKVSWTKWNGTSKFMQCSKSSGWKELALNAQIRKEDPKINNLSFHLRKLEKDDQIKSKVKEKNKN